MAVQSRDNEVKPAENFSSLLRKAMRLGLRLPDDLEKLAILRGCQYYDGANEIADLRRIERLSISEGQFSNVELAVSLLSPSIKRSLWRERLGAAMLGAPGIDDREVAALAVAEGCGPLIRYIAECGHDVEPELPFWKSLLALLSRCAAEPDRKPHPTRFVEMTGITRGKIGIQRRWIRPVAELASV